VTSSFCSPTCRYRFRDRRKHQVHGDRERARSRAHYAANRERVLAKASAKRGKVREPDNIACSECGITLGGPPAHHVR
jgi:hypothetical protein